VACGVVGVGVGRIGLGVGDSSPDGSRDGVGLPKNDGMGVSVGGTVGVGVGWTKIGRLFSGATLAALVGEAAGGADTSTATAPTANRSPARSTAPNASNPWPPPPCGSVDSVRL
jgi:hypothetical protein